MTWSRRYVLKSYIRASLWMVPFFAVLVYFMVSRLGERIGMVNERKVLWKGKAAYLFSAKA